MKMIRLATLVILSTIFFQLTSAQDVRRTETKVADILAQLPAKDSQTMSDYMDELFQLGNDGLNMVCSQVVPSGNGNDTPARFAIESLSRYIAIKDEGAGKSIWEAICLDWVAKSHDIEVKSFFISQLNYFGSDVTVNAMQELIGIKDFAEPAVAAIVAVGSPQSAAVLLQSLKSDNNFAIAATLNGLAFLKSTTISAEILSYATSDDTMIRASAYRALAATGSTEAVPAMFVAAENAGYLWEPSYAVSSLIALASNLGQAGNVKEMDKILKTVLENCEKTGANQLRIDALTKMVDYHGKSAHKLLIKAMKDDDIEYRGAAMRLAAEIDGSDYTALWASSVKKFTGQPKAEIVAMLGERRDKSAATVVTALLNDKETVVRQSAAFAIAKISNKDAIPAITDYLMKYADGDDQTAAAGALVTIVDNPALKVLSSKLSYAPDGAKSTIIGLLAWSKDQAYFKSVLAQTSSDDEGVRATAYVALKNLAPESSQQQLLEMLGKAEVKQEKDEIKLAIAAAAMNNTDKEKRVELLVASLGDEKLKPDILTILAMLGGETAVNAVLKEFRSGNSRTKESCLEALMYWSDHYSLDALYEIFSSEDKNYAVAAFDAYVRQNGRASLTPDQKLLNIKKADAFAVTPKQKGMLVETAGSVKTYLSLFFVGKYLDDPQIAFEAARSAMKIALPGDGQTNGMTGVMVKNILEKSMVNISGNESEYDKERIRKYLLSMDDSEGFAPMFNGVDLSGWQGLVGNPVTRSKMKPDELAAKQKVADEKAKLNWSARDGMIWFSGSGDNLCSVKKYGDFELILDWVITKHGDSGIYLRGSPQVQIWDTSRVDVGAQVGSGGLYNNTKNPSKPLVVADNQVGEWNTFRITMVGEIVNVWLNGILVVDNVVLENYWDRSIPIFPVEAIELQAHGTDLAFRDIYVREINDSRNSLTANEKAEGFTVLFNGKNLDGWVGDKVSYVAEDGMIVIKPEKGSGGNLYTAKEYSDFVYRFEFQLTPGANNGLGIRAPLEGDAAYVGMELQILDNTAPVYANLQPYQYHGSVYGVIPAKRGYLNPVGEWNYQEVIVEGTKIKITLNGTVIVDGDISEARDNGTMDGNDHPGLKRTSGHIGFLGHGSVLKFRNIRIKELSGR